MLRLSDSKFTPASIGDSLRTPVPKVCCTKPGVLMDINANKNMYKIGISQWVLKNLFA